MKINTGWAYHEIYLCIGTVHCVLFLSPLACSCVLHGLLLGKSIILSIYHMSYIYFLLCSFLSQKVYRKQPSRGKVCINFTLHGPHSMGLH
uniref:Putative ovule protein n=1 Tax=Solanum chacoense TaxID=4108 RepID=A0A0V0GNH1_SOLCH